MENFTFYHGGVEPSFTYDDIDVLRLSQKQQTRNGNYAGFYMFDDNNKDGAFHYAEVENIRRKTYSKGVLKLTLDSDINIYELQNNITRVTQEEIINYQSLGYDVLQGNMLGKTEYILLNKEKIVDLEFLPMSMRYNNENSDKPLKRVLVEKN